MSVCENEGGREGGRDLCNDVRVRNDECVLM